MHSVDPTMCQFKACLNGCRRKGATNGEVHDNANNQSTPRAWVSFMHWIQGNKALVLTMDSLIKFEGLFSLCGSYNLSGLFVFSCVAFREGESFVCRPTPPCYKSYTQLPQTIPHTIMVEPLRSLSELEDLPADWTPSTIGFRPPAAVDVERVDIMEQLQSLKRFDVEGKISGSYISTDGVSPGIKIQQKLFALPLGRNEFEVGKSACKVAQANIQDVEMGKVQIINPHWRTSVMKGITSAFANMGAQIGQFHIKLVNLSIVDGPNPRPLETQQSPGQDNHFANAFVVLPSDRSNTSFQARHRDLNSEYSLTESALFSTHFVTLYTGVKEASITALDGPICYLTYHVYAQSRPYPSLKNLTGPGDDIALAVSAWRLRLSAGVQSGPPTPSQLIYQLDSRPYFEDDDDDDEPLSEHTVYGLETSDIRNKKDERLLCHLIPAAKFYGFDVLFASLRLIQSCTWEVYREMEDYDTDYEEESYKMGEEGSDVKTTTEWVITDIQGSELERKSLVEVLERSVWQKKDIMNNHLDLSDDTHHEIEVTFQTQYSDFLTLTAGHFAFYLVVVPSQA
ncbi:hypothetical protein D9611_011404 [Ephemerocybe angulata]|uniref:Uncharacterized protein n=1 Tax=Ephemerocybe angulata TaxID=980116 RepID=A0A8H5CDB4_9AGAR|nr:hypothetical protein D9611_011404 [Tulosesus angulatus]